MLDDSILEDGLEVMFGQHWPDLDHFDLSQIKLLDKKLTDLGIPHETTYHEGLLPNGTGAGIQVCYPVNDGVNRVGSAICRWNMSYGWQRGEIEVDGLLTEEEKPLGDYYRVMPVDAIVDRIVQHYNENKELVDLLKQEKS